MPIVGEKIMFRTIFRFAFFALVMGGWGLAALSLHVVRTPEKIGLIPKERLGFTDTYVDARAWKLSDLSQHPDLVKRVLEADKADLFKYLTDPSKGDVTSQVGAQIGQAGAQETVMAKVKGLFAPTARQAGTDSLPIDF
jgi:hypothetical protein